MRAALGPRTRLVSLVVAIAVAWAGFLLVQPFSKDDVQAWLDPVGAAAPVAYFGAAVVLGLVIVPGALLAAAAGLLFGALAGGALSLAAAVVTGVLGLLIARRVGREGVDALGNARIDAFAAAMERHGLLAVIAQRLAPGVPDGPCNYAAGLVRVRPRHIALGTLIGALPRGFSYAALGDSVDDPTSPQALAALALLGLTGLAGLSAVRRGLVRARTPAE